MAHNFSFVIPGKLAGLARPGSQAPLESDLRILKREGIGALVSLTASPPDPDAVKAAGLKHLHLPILDFTPPTAEQIGRFVDFTDKAIEDGTAVAVHCTAGQGRTGTMLACYLVHLGESAEEAIESVRLIRPGSIETFEQAASVADYARVHTAQSNEESA